MTTVTKTTLATLALSALAAAGFAPRLAAQARPAAAAPAQTAAQQNFDNVPMQVLHVQGNVYMIVGAGGNTTVQAGDTGVLVVDTQFAPLSAKLLAAIRTFSPKPIHYIINTHVHDDHIGGNENLAKAGPTRPDRLPADAGLGGNTGGQTTIIAHENVLNRMVANGPDARPAGLWPTDTYFEGDKEVFFNGEAVQIIHPPAAHTDGDSIVFFRRSDVIATGDIFTTTMYPFIDAPRGGSVNGIIDALNRIIDIAIPDHKVQEGGTMIVPGHGRLCDEQDVIEYRDMVTIVRDRIQYMIKKGMTLDQVKAAKPTLDFDPRYGTDTGFWTTTMFIDTIYRELSRKK